MGARVWYIGCMIKKTLADGVTVVRFGNTKRSSTIYVHRGEDWFTMGTEDVKWGKWFFDLVCKEGTSYDDIKSKRSSFYQALNAMVVEYDRHCKELDALLLTPEPSFNP